MTCSAAMLERAYCIMVIAQKSFSLSWSHNDHNYSYQTPLKSFIKVPSIKKFKNIKAAGAH